MKTTLRPRVSFSAEVKGVRRLWCPQAEFEGTRVSSSAEVKGVRRLWCPQAGFQVSVILAHGGIEGPNIPGPCLCDYSIYLTLQRDGDGAPGGRSGAGPDV